MIKNRANDLKRKFYDEKASQINQAQINRDLEKVFRIAKNHEVFNEKALTPATCTTLAAHFESHFNKAPPEEIPTELVNLPEYLHQQFGEIPVGVKSNPPSKTELVQAVKRLKYRKATTDIPAEILKVLIDDPEELENLHQFFCEVWRTDKTPEDWNYCRLKALYKKGDPKLASNYRGLSVSSMLLKVLCSMVLVRLRPWYEASLLEGQFGFRENRGCQDAIYCLRQVQQIYHQMKKELYAGFIDLKAAFDWIPRKFLFKSLKARNINENEALHYLIEILENFYRETYNFMTGDSKAEAFETTSGVRQGASDSPTLFVAYLDFILRIYEKECKDEGLGIKIKYGIPNECTDRGERRVARSSGTLWLLWLGFADDLAILADSKADLERAIQKLYDIFVRFGLLMSIDKTKTMVMGDIDDEEYPEKLVKVNGKFLENHKFFIYLGQKFQHNDPYTPECELLGARKGSAMTAFIKNEKFFTNQKIAINTRRKVYDSLYRSKLTYCCQTWSSTATKLAPIYAAYNQNLRRLVRGGTSRLMTPLIDEAELQDQEDQRYDMAYTMKNERIFEITGATPLETYIRDQKINWFGHVCRLSNKHYAKMLTFHTEVNRRSGQPLNTLKKYVTDLFRVQDTPKKKTGIFSILDKFTRSKELVVPIQQIYKMLRERKESYLKDILNSGLVEN